MITLETIVKHLFVILIYLTVAFAASAFTTDLKGNMRVWALVGGIIFIAYLILRVRHELANRKSL